MKALFAAAFLAVAAAPGFAASPQHHAIIFGGGCESSDPYNMFQAPVAHTSSSLIGRGWSVLPLFGGKKAEGHDPAFSRDPVALASRLEPSEVKSATRENLLDALSAELSLPPGSELFLAIETHGKMARGSEHYAFCAGDEKNLMTDDPDFVKILSQLRAQGIRIGFMDTSCFSGGAIPDLSRFGCVLTSQTQDRESHLTAAGPDLEGLLDDSSNKNVSMRTVFLRALAQSQAESSDDPQMSGTTEGQDLSDLINSLRSIDGGEPLEEYLPISQSCPGGTENTWKTIQDLGVFLAPLRFQELDDAWRAQQGPHDGPHDGQDAVPFSELAEHLKTQGAEAEKFEAGFDEDAKRESALLQNLVQILIANPVLRAKGSDILKGVPNADLTDEQRRRVSELRLIRSRIEKVYQANGGASEPLRKMRVYVDQARFAAEYLKLKSAVQDDCSRFVF